LASLVSALPSAAFCRARSASSRPRLRQPQRQVVQRQELEPGGDQRRRDEREQLSTMARSLLRRARRHEVPLVLISSVARDKYDAERPTLAAFKGSGDIEYTLDAGLVVRIAAESPEDYERLRRAEDEIPLELRPEPRPRGRPPERPLTGNLVPTYPRNQVSRGSDPPNVLFRRILAVPLASRPLRERRDPPRRASPCESARLVASSPGAAASGRAGSAPVRGQRSRAPARPWPARPRSRAAGTARPDRTGCPPAAASGLAGTR
jgi:DnaB-like helicase C terminal domain